MASQAGDGELTSHGVYNNHEGLNERALGLSAPKLVCRHVNGTGTVRFFAHFYHGNSYYGYERRRFLVNQIEYNSDY